MEKRNKILYQIRLRRAEERRTLQKQLDARRIEVLSELRKQKVEALEEKLRTMQTKKRASQSTEVAALIKILDSVPTPRNYLSTIGIYLNINTYMYIFSIHIGALEPSRDEINAALEKATEKEVLAGRTILNTAPEHTDLLQGLEDIEKEFVQMGLSSEAIVILKEAKELDFQSLDSIVEQAGFARPQVIYHVQFNRLGYAICHRL